MFNAGIPRYRPHAALPLKYRNSSIRYYQNPHRMTTNKAGMLRSCRGFPDQVAAESCAHGSQEFRSPEYCKVAAAEFDKAGVKSNPRNRPSFPSIQMPLATEEPRIRMMRFDPFRAIGLLLARESLDG
jgi:hypothetical protein